MSEFLDSLNFLDGAMLWGIAPWRVVAALMIIFVGFASRKLIQALFSFLGRKAGSTKVQWDDEATRLLAKPLAVVIQLLLWRVAAALLLLPTEPFDTRLAVAQGLEAALMVALVWVFFRIIDVLASVATRFTHSTKTRIDDQAVPLLRKTFKVFIGLLGFVFIVSNLGFNVLSVLAGLGIGGLALALAAQDSVANFFGSVVLFTDAPFQVEDYVEVGGVSGTVEEVGFRTTRIRQDDSSIVCVPNQTFTGSFIT
ncbi:MAG: mechanosensitive ion channel, partial [Rhodothermaceae bacterium]|nr:mechanosensitive ion channel [Rhodothermaceae bacterium]